MKNSLPSGLSYGEKELLQRIAEGDEMAFRELYDTYERLLRPYLSELTRSDSISGDLIQETLLRVWLNREHISTLDHPRAYIYRIAANLAYTWIREQLTRKRLEKATASGMYIADEGETLLSVKAIRRIVQQTITNMPPQRSRIYLMHREQGMKTAAIAKELGVSVSTVKNTLSVAMKNIREEVEKAGYFFPVWLIFLSQGIPSRLV